MGQDVLVDPHAGPCNDLNSDSWWKEQKPYLDPNINAVLTHTATPEFPTCPTSEITHEKDAFAEDETVYFAVYLRDQIAGTNLNLKILKPDASVFAEWDYNLVDNYNSSFWNWSSKIPTIPGNWTWRATYQGQVLDHNFTIGTLSTEEENFKSVSIYPNPFNDVININSNSPVKKVSVFDILGKIVITQTNTVESIKEINLESLSRGIYFLRLEGYTNQQ